MSGKRYVIRGGEEGRKRLRVLARVNRPFTIEFLNLVGIDDGMHCMDLGSGGGDVALELAKMVGQTGRIVGIDFDDAKIQIAKKEAFDTSFNNVAFRILDVLDWNEDSRYDRIYSRFLLTHLDTPKKIIQSMVNAVKPGGAILIEDIDFSGHFCYPECTAFDRYVELYQKVVSRKGADPDIGPKLPIFLKEAGLNQVNFRMIQPTFMEGQGKIMAQITLKNIADALLAEGLSDESEIDSLLKGLDDFAQSPTTIMSLPRIFQVWGYRR